MSKMNAAQRDGLKSSQFLMPKERKLPVNDESHWRAARGRIHNVKGISEQQRQALIAKWERVGKSHGWLKSDSQDKAKKLTDVMDQLISYGFSDHDVEDMCADYAYDDNYDDMCSMADQMMVNPWQDRMDSMKCAGSTYKVKKAKERQELD